MYVTVSTSSSRSGDGTDGTDTTDTTSTTDRIDKSDNKKVTIKLDFPGNLCRAAFAIFAMFKSVFGFGIFCPEV